jgi:KRAB domain-containing zinc finger protein
VCPLISKPSIYFPVELDDQSNQSLEVKPKQTRKEKNMHQCPECDKRFLKKGILTKHLKSHSQLRPFICDTDDCEKSFVNARALEKHVKSVHQGEDVMLHLCQFCQKAFITRAEMDSHAETHLADYKMYACRFCGKTFNKKFSMKIAVQASHDKPPEPCPFCNKLINSKAYTDN